MSKPKNKNPINIPFYGVTPKLNVSKKIALVGNSDILFRKDYSKEINSFGTVIRFNYGDVIGKFTGTKTTIRWLNGPLTHTCARHYNNKIVDCYTYMKFVKRIFKNCAIIAWPVLYTKMRELTGNKRCHQPNNLHIFKNVNAFLKQLGIITRFSTAKKNCWPRTGFHAILTCIRSGCIPYLYGFDIHEKNRIGHYGDGKFEQVTNDIVCHQVRTEIKVLKEMSRKKLVVFRI